LEGLINLCGDNAEPDEDSGGENDNEAEIDEDGKFHES